MTGVTGSWRIESVQVNADKVVNEDFDRLVVSPSQITIEPAGIRLSVHQSTSRSAILESRSDLFFAEYFKRDGQLTLELTRPAFREKVRFDASLA